MQWTKRDKRFIAALLWRCLWSHRGRGERTTAITSLAPSAKKARERKTLKVTRGGHCRITFFHRFIRGKLDAGASSIQLPLHPKDCSFSSPFKFSLDFFYSFSVMTQQFIQNMSEQTSPLIPSGAGCCITSRTCINKLRMSASQSSFFLYNVELLYIYIKKKLNWEREMNRHPKTEMKEQTNWKTERSVNV